MLRFKLRFVLALLALAALAGAAWLVVVERPLTVPVARLERDVTVQVFGLGTVEARILSRVGFKVAGTLAELRADHGDWVKAGTVLGRLDSAEQETRVAKAGANLERARAALLTAKANVVKAAALRAQREQVHDRRQALLRAGNVSIEAAQDAQAAFEVARADHAVAASEVATAEAQLKDAEAELEFQKVLLAQHTLAAPYDALVVARHRELGAVLTTSEPLFTLIDPNTVWVLAHVDEAAAGDLRLGQPVAVRLRSMPRRSLEARIVRIDIESDRVSEERRVYVACRQCPEEFHLGEQAEVLITTRQLASALLVPQTAVERFDGQHGMVWTIEEGRLARREVAFGARLLDGRVEVLSGLPDGAAVVAELAPGLRVGRRATAQAGP